MIDYHRNGISAAPDASAEGLYARAYSDSQQVEEDPRAPPCARCAHAPAREIGGWHGLARAGSPGGRAGGKIGAVVTVLVSRPRDLFLQRSPTRHFLLRPEFFQP
jgi:hypothetical protein